ncbi:MULTISPECIES: AAA family ATPase [unclassified Acidovorax]|uniref:AAA family ATPase n=1 Tax=unclassified Acidovorax TaxID=2684926 RepID=UPI000AED7D2F|nr:MULTISPECIES: AAA family ATPase [unclassified Acidovorax]
MSVAPILSPAGGLALVVLGGLPGVGKSTVARALLAQWRAVYLRIDTIEQALRDSMALQGDVGPAGYVVAYALARTQLAQGLPVLVDCVNPLAVTRHAWHAVARDAQAPCLDVEIICSDIHAHRQRVDTRPTDVPGLVPPRWEAVLQHDYAPWPEGGHNRVEGMKSSADASRMVIDTAAHTAEQAAAKVLAALRALTVRAAGRGRD